jgi:hypothetical protein
MSTPQAVKLPLEPRHIAEFAAFDDQEAHPLKRALRQAAGYQESGDPSQRRGPRIGPTPDEEILLQAHADVVEVGFGERGCSSGDGAPVGRQPGREGVRR